MNKISGVNPDCLKDDFKFIQKLEFDNSKLQDTVWSRFCEKSNKENKKAKFQNHPKEILSDVETSISNSPKHLQTPRSTSSINLQLYNVQKDIKRQLHSKIITFNNNCLCNIDVGFEEGPLTSPKALVEKKSDKQLSKRNLNSKPKNITCKRAPALTAALKRVIPTALKNSVNEMSIVVFEKKFKVFAEKSINVLTDIRYLIETGINPPDGDEDTSRRLMRVKEFSSRFSRNYLYPLERQLHQLQAEGNQNLGLYQKIISAYQLVLNGLQAYYSHLPSSIGNGAADKLKILLNSLVKLCNIHENFTTLADENDAVLKLFKTNVQLTLQHLADDFSVKSSESILKSNATKISLPKTNLGVGRQKKDKMQSRFSMYSTSAAFRKDQPWRYAVQALAKKKYNVKSRYKTAAFMHRPPLEKAPADGALPIKCKLLAKQVSSGNLGIAPVNSPVNEDNITTLIQMENERADNGEKAFSNMEEQMIHKDIAIKLYKLVRDNQDKRNLEPKNCSEVRDSPEKLSELIEQCIKSEEGKRLLGNLLEELKKGDQGSQQLVLEENAGKGTRKKPKITWSGVRNARLICIKDDNSIVDDDDETDKENQKNVDKEIPLKLKTQTVARKTNKLNKSTQENRKSSKMSRMQRPAKLLQLLPKDYAVNVIQYKLDFKSHCRNKPLYIKSDNLQPWILMDKIADELLHDTLLSVAKEIQLNDVVEKIYQGELQM